MNLLRGRSLGSGNIGSMVSVLLENGQVVTAKAMVPIVGEDVVVALGSPNLVWSKYANQEILQQSTHFFKKRPKPVQVSQEFDVCLIYTKIEDGYVSCTCPSYGKAGDTCIEICDITGDFAGQYPDMKSCILDFTLDDPWVTVGYLKRGYWEDIGVPDYIRGWPYPCGLSIHNFCFEGRRWDAGYHQPNARVITEDGTGSFTVRDLAVPAPSTDFATSILYSDAYFGEAFYRHFYHVPDNFVRDDIVEQFENLYDIYRYRDDKSTLRLFNPGQRQEGSGRHWDFAYYKKSDSPDIRYTRIQWLEVPNTWWREIEFDSLIMGNKIYMLDDIGGDVISMWHIADANIPIAKQQWRYANLILGRSSTPARLLTRTVRNSAPDKDIEPPPSAGYGWQLLWDERGCKPLGVPPGSYRNKKKRVFYARFGENTPPVKILELNSWDPYLATCTLGVGNLIYVTIKAGKEEKSYVVPPGTFIEWCQIHSIGSGDPTTVYSGRNPSPPTFYDGDSWKDRNRSFSVEAPPKVNACAENFQNQITGGILYGEHTLTNSPQTAIFDFINQKIYTFQLDQDVTGINPISLTSKSGKFLEVLLKYNVPSVGYVVYNANEKPEDLTTIPPTPAQCLLNPGDIATGTLSVGAADPDPSVLEKDIAIVAIFPYPKAY